MRTSKARVTRPFALALAAVVLAGPALAFTAPAAADPPGGFATVKVLGNLGAGQGGNPTSFAYAPDGRIFIGRKAGVVNVWDGGTQHTFLDLRDEVNSVQSRGLVGLTLDPGFPTNGRVYV